MIKQTELYETKVRFLSLLDGLEVPNPSWWMAADAESLKALGNAISGQAKRVKEDGGVDEMTDKEKELMAAYQGETEKCCDVAQLLDGQSPTLPGAFTGTPSERIVRQLQARGVAPFDVKTPW